MTTACEYEADIVGGELVGTLGRWEPFDETTIECRVLICPEDDGGYSAYATRLPGVAGQGDSFEECLEDVREAFRATIAEYRESGEEIPWKDVDLDRPKTSTERWILVDVKNTVEPLATKLDSRSRIVRDATASTPSKGSSRKSNLGFGNKAAANESFLRIPCE